MIFTLRLLHERKNNRQQHSRVCTTDQIVPIDRSELAAEIIRNENKNLVNLIDNRLSTKTKRQTFQSWFFSRQHPIVFFFLIFLRSCIQQKKNGHLIRKMKQKKINNGIDGFTQQSQQISFVQKIFAVFFIVVVVVFGCVKSNGVSLLIFAVSIKPNTNQHHYISKHDGAHTIFFSRFLYNQNIQ